MRTVYNVEPLFRSSIGFDRIVNLLENAAGGQTIDSWPPYNIEKIGDDRYRITVAAVGLSPDELKVTQEPNLLVVGANMADDEDRQYLHRGFVVQPFVRRFSLADHVTVAGATFHNGLLAIDLLRDLPDAMKPHRIEIQTPDALAKGRPQRIEQKKQAA